MDWWRTGSIGCVTCLAVIANAHKQTRESRTRPLHPKKDLIDCDMPRSVAQRFCRLRVAGVKENTSYLFVKIPIIIELRSSGRGAHWLGMWGKKKSGRLVFRITICVCVGTHQSAMVGIDFLQLTTSHVNRSIGLSVWWRQANRSIRPSVCQLAIVRFGCVCVSIFFHVCLGVCLSVSHIPTAIRSGCQSLCLPTASVCLPTASTMQCASQHKKTFFGQSELLKSFSNCWF